MKKNTIIFLTCFYLVMIFPLRISAQNYFNKLITPDSTFGTSVIIEDSGYLLTGAISINTSYKMFICRLNSTGDTLWQRNYGADSSNHFPQEVTKKRDTYFIAGYVNDTANENNSDFFLSRLDSIGNIQWYFRYGGDGDDKLFNLLKSEDDGFLLSGSTSSFGLNNEDFLLLKIDSLGNLIWQQTYGGLGYDLPNGGLIHSNNNGFILTGESTSNNGTLDILLIETDSIGNLKSQTFIGGQENDYGGQIIRLSDGNYLIYKNTFDTISFVTTAWLVKMDQNYQIIWEQEYDSPNFYYSEFFADPIENEDGTIMASATGRDSTINKLVGILTKIDPMGNPIWQRGYLTSLNASPFISEIKATSDSGFVFCGFAVHDSAGINRYAWIVKTDCFGCDSYNCYLADSACYVYDCTLYPIDAFFTSSTDTIDLTNGSSVLFDNSSLNSSARTWNFGDAEFGYTTDTISHSYSQTGTYTVSLIVYHGKCTDTFTKEIVVINTVGVTENGKDNSTMKIYPNPSRGDVTIEFYFSHPTNGSAIEIFDVTGKFIQSFVLDNSNGKIVLSNENFKSGIYFCNLMNENKVLQRRKIVFLY